MDKTAVSRRACVQRTGGFAAGEALLHDAATMNARSGTWRRMSANLRRRRDIRAESFAYAVAVRYVKRPLAKPPDASQNSICVATPTPN